MAVTQISKIQVRYGLQEDIGTLDGGEFAWAIDTQRLFIGNGLVEEGAPVAGMTEIMTGGFDTSQILGNYTYRGVLGGYQVLTGPDANNDVVRSFQDKIDDFVNVRDYGVSSTGNIDETESLQRAIDETYNRLSPVTGQRTRRAIRLNGGTYRIDGELRIPPYATFIGEGKESVKILLNGPAARLTTNTGASSSVENTLGQFPRLVHFKGLTLQRNNDNDILEADGATEIVFEDVAFVGPRTNPNTIGNGVCVSIKSTVEDTSGVHFQRCTFRGLGYAAYVTAETNTNNINFTNCTFESLWGGIRTELLPNGVIKGIKVSNCIFKDIYSHAIYGDLGVTGMVSTGNTYINCASGLEGDISPIGVWQPIIVFQANGNYSFMDIFARQPGLADRVSGETYNFAYMSLDEYFALGSAQRYAGIRHSVGDGQSFNLPMVAVKHGIINYSLERGATTRTGVISFSSNNGAIVWSDDYTESADLGVTLNVSVDTSNNNTISFNGVTTATGQVTKVSFDLKHLA